ncbi:MAG: type II toxin-antitoxin system PemK/MazF family toxin [Myxococcales bacterium]
MGPCRQAAACRTGFQGRGNDVRALVIVAPASTTVRGYAVEVKLGKKQGLPRNCVINCDWLVTLPKADLVERVEGMSGAKLRELDDALRFALGLND